MLPQRLIQPETEPVYLPPREMTEDQLALIAKPKAPRETDIQKMFMAGSAVWDAMYRPRDVTATPAIAVTVRILYCISLWLPLAILSETKPARKTIAISAIQGQEAQKPMDFKDML